MHRNIVNSDSDVFRLKRRNDLRHAQTRNLLQYEKWSVKMVRMARIRLVGRREQ